MADSDDLDDAAVARAVANATAAAGHHVTAWIVGITFALLLAPIIGLSCAMGGGWGGPPRFPYGARWGALFAAVTVAAVAVVTVALTRRANARIARETRQLLAEGTRRRGRIAAARRVSMTQAKVIIQGETFPAFERMVSTALSDAALLNRAVEVYTHPSLVSLVILPE
jgi:membrane protein implicated in regulation of membrane protease activity